MLKTQNFRQTGYYVADNDRYNIQELTCEQLRIHFGTGRSIYDAAPVYMIIFTATDGGQTCYMLNDHILIDNAAKKETVLTEEQYVQLLQALGVVLKKEDGK